MKKKHIIILVIFAIIVVAVFRKYLLLKITEGSEKELFSYETVDYRFDLRINKELGCAKRGIDFKNDTIEIDNYKLENLLYYITNKNINTSNIHEVFGKHDSGYNFYYYPKTQEGKINLQYRDVLSKIGTEFKFSYKYDSVAKISYTPFIYDENMLLKYMNIGADNSNNNSLRLGKNYIQFMSCNLPCIMNALTFYIKGIIIDLPETPMSDSVYYSFKIPSTENEEIITYLYKKLGIKMIRNTKTIEELTIEKK